MTNNWHPRGEATWPDWKKAPEGTRFRHNRTGRTGTFIKVSSNRNNGAVVRWDPAEDASWQPTERAYVIAPAFDLTPIDPST